ncbi:MAG TPA: chorismate mutase, partial [Candidatus Aphodomonas merdavium]|nr:chorismate mutase [Candidatus Aphodomonas merdavium]
MSLEPLRARIDEIDASLLRLFQERMDVSAQIAAQKRRDGLPVYDAARERAKAKAFHDAARPPYGPYAQELYASLCALSRRYQRCLATPLRAGLLGRTLQHSFSPLIHSFFGDYSYDLFEVEPQQLESFVLSGPFDALNVTIPYKKAVLPYCGKL